MNEHRVALSALAIFCLLAVVPGAVSAQTSPGSGAQAKPKGAVASQPSAGGGAADPVAMKICREKIAHPSDKVKVGALKPLGNQTLRYVPGRFQSKYVPLSNVRMYAARVVSPNLFGVEIDHLQVCFLERTGNTYRFVQVCRTKHRSGQFDNCNLSWIIPDHMRGKYPGT